MRQRIAFLGVGRMGGRMAKRLQDAGHDVTVYDPDAGATAAFEAAASLREAAAAADFILCSLPNPPIVREAVTAALAAARPGAVIVDLSTGDPTTARELAKQAKAKDVGFLDAPVSRGVAGAEHGTLLIMVGGEEATLDRARPILEPLASDIVHVGPTGAGQATKLCNQMLTATIATALGEVLTAGVRAGVDLGTLIEVLEGGSAGNWVLSEHLPNTLLTDDRETSFSLALMRKDVGLFAAANDLPLSNLVKARFDDAHERGLDDADYTSIAELYENGVRLAC